MSTDRQQDRKARGAFFTPPILAEFMVNWSVRSGDDTILEPSCGEAVFLESAAQKLSSFGDRGRLPGQISGVEIHEESAESARESLEQLGYDSSIRTANFFDVASTPTFDAVVGNPPYIRYQDFSGDDRIKAKQTALAHGVRFDGLANSWAPFLVHAASFLKTNGRLALVLPGELLSVNYAAPARRFLMERFERVALVVFNKRVFPEVLEEVVIVLAEGQGPTDHCELYQADDASDLNDLIPWRWTPARNTDKWMAALLPSSIAELYRETHVDEKFATLLDWGETDLGMVTGNNKYFTMSMDTASKWKIEENEFMRISPPSSRHLRCLMFGEQSWKSMAKDGARVLMFRPTEKKLSAGAARYIAFGEEQGFHTTYKCRVRSPWWKVPLVKVPDLFFTYMNHDAPRLVSNRARLRYLNSIHGVNLAPGLRRLGTDLLPIACLNSLTLLGAELVGRAYGGGMLKLEPKEADCLPVPSVKCIEEVANQLRGLRPQLARALRTNDLEQVVRQVDKIVLRRGLRLTQSDIDELAKGREIMFKRRVARSGKAR